MTDFISEARRSASSVVWASLYIRIIGSVFVICFNPFTVPYNLIEDWEFKGIKCIETQEKFDTPG